MPERPHLTSTRPMPPQHLATGEVSGPVRRIRHNDPHVRVLGGIAGGRHCEAALAWLGLASGPRTLHPGASALPLPLHTFHRPGEREVVATVALVTLVTLVALVALIALVAAHHRRCDESLCCRCDAEPCAAADKPG